MAGPQVNLSFDYTELEKFAVALGGRLEQVPYATALALNRSADVTRQFLIKATWPSHVNMRNPSFIAASLTTKEARATKGSLAVEIYDRLDRGNLLLQAEGGVRKPKGGGNLAIPSSKIPRSSRGVPSRLRPKNLKNSFKKNGMLFARNAKGRVQLIYSLKPATKVPKRVPFREDFAVSMAREMRRTFPMAMAKAMSTARVK